MSSWVTNLIIVASSILALVFAAIYRAVVGNVAMDNNGRLLGVESHIAKRVHDISLSISDGAAAFLSAEFKIMGYFIVGFSVILAIALGFLVSASSAIFTVIAFILGSLTSMLSGYIGMRIAVYSNSRTAVAASQSYEPAFNVAFKAGCVMGFALTGLGVLVLFIIVNLFRLKYTNAFSDPEETMMMFECIAGYGLGGSSIALFGRVGGGIYTKAADVGADLCKIDYGMNEDSPQNPAVIADNVGDNVGDVAGMGADLFGSFAESSCAAMVIASQSPDLFSDYSAMCFPLIVASFGILTSFLTSFFATHIDPCRTKSDIQPVLKKQLIISTILMTAGAYIACVFFLPSSFSVSNKTHVTQMNIFWCIISGLWSGLIIGLITEYYTSHSYEPVREVSRACRSGAATNIIYGLALGYKSVIIPIFCMAITIYISYSFAGMFGIANAALGILSTMSIGLAIDAYGPICDNAGGIAEMSGMSEAVRDRTDALDSAGNTTAAIGKGFAIGSAALVALALFGAFVSSVKMTTVNILEPFQFSGLLVGAMLPYWFSALTMKSVGEAAQMMIQEVDRQFTARPELIDACKLLDREEELKELRSQQANGEINDVQRIEALEKAFHEDSARLAQIAPPDYAACVAISTEASLREMIPPGALVMLTPLVVGFLFGVEALAGVLAGTLSSGVQMAISSSNTGGAWDNAKKYIEAGLLREMVTDRRTGETKQVVFGKGTKEHKAAVIGDTVGDPLKDTSGPALNILVKLSAIISLVFAKAFPSVEDGGWLVQLANKISA